MREGGFQKSQWLPPSTTKSYKQFKKCRLFHDEMLFSEVHDKKQYKNKVLVNECPNSTN